MRPTECRLIRLFSATDCEASEYKDWISVVLPQLNACRVRMRVVTTNNILLGMQRLAFPLEIFQKGVVSQIKMEASQNVAGNKKISRSSNYTVCAFLLMRRYFMDGRTGPAGISSFHTVVTAGFTAQQQWTPFATGHRSWDKQEKFGTI